MSDAPLRRRKRPLRCRLGLHKKQSREGFYADKTLIAIGVILMECERCDWHMKGMGET